MSNPFRLARRFMKATRLWRKGLSWKNAMWMAKNDEYMEWLYGTKGGRND